MLTYRKKVWFRAERLETLEQMNPIPNYILCKGYPSYLTFRGPCIVIYSCNKSQQDELILNLILVKTLHVSDRFLSIIRSLNTVFTATAICHKGYVDCLLADSQHN